MRLPKTLKNKVTLNNETAAMVAHACMLTQSEAATRVKTLLPDISDTLQAVVSHNFESTVIFPIVNNWHELLFWAALVFSTKYINHRVKERLVDDSDGLLAKNSENIEKSSC